MGIFGEFSIENKLASTYIINVKAPLDTIRWVYYYICYMHSRVFGIDLLAIVNIFSNVSSSLLKSVVQVVYQIKLLFDMHSMSAQNNETPCQFFLAKHDGCASPQKCVVIFPWFLRIICIFEWRYKPVHCVRTNHVLI